MNGSVAHERTRAVALARTLGKHASTRAFQARRLAFNLTNCPRNRCETSIQRCNLLRFKPPRLKSFQAIEQSRALLTYKEEPPHSEGSRHIGHSDLTYLVQCKERLLIRSVSPHLMHSAIAALDIQKPLQGLFRIPQDRHARAQQIGSPRAILSSSLPCFPPCQTAGQKQSENRPNSLHPGCPIYAGIRRCHLDPPSNCVASDGNDTSGRPGWYGTSYNKQPIDQT